ncbi:MAG: hypothetical protein PHI29_07780 [Gallionella sp.]|nr:hypothetical protein [Gallionella sp.]
MHRTLVRGVRGVVQLCCALALLILLPGYAQADLIGDIAVKTDANGELDAVIKFTVPIQHLRYSQQNKSSTFLVVYFNVLESGQNDQWQDFETHRSPPLEVAPDFTVTMRDLTMSPRLEVQFSRAADYTLKAGRDGRSLVLHIKPDVIPSKGSEQQVIAPVVVTAAVSPQPAAQPAYADLIEGISITTDNSKGTDAILRFSAPVQRLRVAKQTLPASSLSVYFDIPERVRDTPWKDFAVYRSPSSDLIPGFTATAKDLESKPKIDIQFEHATEYALVAGKDGRSLILHFKAVPVKPAETTGVTAAIVPALVIAAPIVATAPSLPISIPTPAKKTAVAEPTPAKVAEATPQPEPEPAAKIPEPVVTTPPPVAKSEPAPELPPSAVVKPVIKQSAARTKGKAQLGGKDGLPQFPDVDDTAVVENTPLPAGLTLAEQIKYTDMKAAGLMVKGRDAILSGDMFAAIDSFNNVLKLATNRYTEDAQVWVAIAREKAGQPYKAQSEYETYLKLYPKGTAAMWVKDRYAKLSAVLPPLPKQETVAVRTQRTDFKNMEYGSVSTYYYRGRSSVNTVTNVAGVPIPTNLTRTDQSTMLTNVMMTDRFYNNEFDNRLVFQGFRATNFLPQQPSSQQLNAFYMDVRNRIEDYSVRVGRQSPYGGGVTGRFDGATAGYGVTPDYRVNVVAGRLSDAVIGPKPVFFGTGVDLGVKDAVGGSVYVIKQTVKGLTSRQALGGNMRYFDHGTTAMAMLDYDTKFRAVNWATLQGTLHDDAQEMDYNFLLDRRRSPVLDIRNSVMGTTNGVDVLLQNGFTQSDLLNLAKQRTASSTLAMLGVNKRIAEKWQAGGDISVSSISGLPQSGTIINGVQVGSTLVGGTPGLEGFIPATPSTGAAWTFSGRLIGNDFITDHDISIASLSYTKSHQMTGQMLLLTNHSNLHDQLTLDSTLRLYLQKDQFGGKQSVLAPVVKFGYRMGKSLTLDTEGGIELTNSTPSTLQSSKTNRQYFSVGFRWDF